MRSLDELDRRIVVALQQDGRASWTAIAEMVDASLPTVARRGQQLIADGIVRIAVSPAPGSTGPADAFIIRINCQPGTQVSVAAQLVENPGMRFVAIVTGRYDIVAEMVVSGGAASYPNLIAELQSIDNVERWRSDLIMHVYKISSDWSNQLLKERLNTSGEPQDRADKSPMEPGSPGLLDEADLKILEVLRDDGREAVQTIADRLGMNESSVRRRFEQMRNSNSIDIVTLVPAPALGMGAETLLTVRVAPSRMDEVARELAKYSSVRYLAATLDENALFCEVITRSSDDLYEFITSTLSALDGVEGWTASMELLFLKRGFAETPWWRAQLGTPGTP